MPFFTDQLHREVFINSTPQRIISLVPSQTELLYHLGFDREVAGITKFCTEPNSWVKSKPRVGGTKNIHIDKIRSLMPDLIIANKEENMKDQVEVLAQDYPVWISDVFDLNSALDMIRQIGHITSRVNESIKLSQEIKKGFEALTQASLPMVRTLYLIWREPYMSVGGDTFINDMLQYAGFDNILKSKSRYPMITTTELAETNSELILLSSEPYPFSQKNVHEIEELFNNRPGAPKIRLVDGAIFSWYGSRLLQAPSYFMNLRTSM